MSTDRGMDKEAVVQICNEIFLSHKKGCIWVSPNEVDEPRANYKEWSKSERDKQRLCINACIWSLDRWHGWAYRQSSNGDTDREQTYGHGYGVRKERARCMESNMETYTAAAAKSLQSCPTLCDPIDGSPPGSLIPGTLQARTLEWVAISFFNAWKWKVKSLSCVRPPATGSSVLGICQARVLEWGTIAFSLDMTEQRQIYSYVHP